MRLLFDEQLSERLPELLRDVFPNSLHVRQLGATGASDLAVWSLAMEHSCVLVTKDQDFHRLSILRGAPPKVVWIRQGNRPIEAVAAVLRHHYKAIHDFVEQDEATFLALV